MTSQSVGKIWLKLSSCFIFIRFLGPRDWRVSYLYVGSQAIN